MVIKLYQNQINRLRKSFFDAYEKEDILKAIIMGEKILKIYENNGGEEGAYFCDDAYNLACVYSKDGKFANSVSLYKKSAEILERIQGKNLQYTYILNNLAIDLHNLGDYKSSLKIFKEVYSVRKNILEESHIDYINSVLNLGNAYFEINDIENALKYHKKSLSLREAKDIDYIDNLNLIGYDLEENGNFEEAAEYLTDALDIIKKIRGGRSEEYLQNIYYLGFVYEKAKNFLEAKNCYEKSAELIRLYVKDDHPYYAETLNKLANSYLRIGNENKALTLRIKSLNIIKGIVGKNHLYYASNLKNIGDIYFKKGDFKRAKAMYEESIETKKNILGTNNDEYVRDSSMLAKAYIKEKEFSSAKKILEYLTFYLNNAGTDTNINIKNEGEGKDFYISLLLDLAFIYISTNDTQKLYSIYKEFEEAEPGLSFDEMLEDIKYFSENGNIPYHTDVFPENPEESKTEPIDETYIEDVNLKDYYGIDFDIENFNFENNDDNDI